MLKMGKEICVQVREKVSERLFSDFWWELWHSAGSLSFTLLYYSRLVR